MPRKLEGLKGYTYPGEIWKDFMERAHEGKEPLAFLPYAQMADKFLEDTAEGNKEQVSDGAENAVTDDVDDDVEKIGEDAPDEVVEIRSGRAGSLTDAAENGIMKLS